MRNGKLKITVVTDYGTKTTTYKVAEFEVGSRLFVAISDVDGFACSIRWFMDLDLSNKTQLDQVFNEMGTNTYEWLEPLTEVPSQGGGSGITIDDVYPIGIEITTTDTTFNPMKVWGGTWTVSPAGAKRVWTRTA